MTEHTFFIFIIIPFSTAWYVFCFASSLTEANQGPYGAVPSADCCPISM
jgi:hypothetical protein